MEMSVSSSKHAYTIIELMVLVVIVSVLAATVGVFVVKLLTLQEQNRGEAYIREKLVDICGVYADYLSVGSSISNNMSKIDPAFSVMYRQETSGISFETGRVSHVAHMTLSERTYKSSRTLGFTITALDSNNSLRDISNEFRGEDTPLVPLKDLKINDKTVKLSCQIYPLNVAMENAALWNLQLMAYYEIENDRGDVVLTNTTVSRVVRLWNWE